MHSITKIYSFISLCILLGISASAQVIVSVPVFPRDFDSVTVIFDASQGSGGLLNYTGEVYAHTGVITQNSASPSDWKYVKSNWGENKPETKTTKIGPNLYRLVIKPSIRSYYSVPAGEKIQKLAFVFRSATAVGGSYLEGKDVGGLDLYVNVYESGLQLNLNKPLYGFRFVELSDTLHLKAESSMADSMHVYVNDTLLASSPNAVINIDYIITHAGSFEVKAIAFDSANSLSDSFLCFVRGAVQVAPLPIGIRPGINPVSSTEIILALYAPLKQFAHVLGDFNNWLPDSVSYMKRSPDGNYYWISLSGLTPGKEYIYQYLVDGDIRIGDPYAEKVSDPWNDQYIAYPGILPYPSTRTSGIATVFSTTPDIYVWQNQQFSPPAKENLVVYELLVRDFLADHSYKSLADTLDYLQRLGVNAIELMPVNEFEGNSSWGYNTNYYFAVDKYYGTKNELKAFIDTCHQRGIAVILDVVYNHSFSTSPYVKLYWDEANDRPSANSPFYNVTARHDYNVGYDFNHESLSTRTYVSRALKFWLEEFKVDGYRFDLSKGFTQRYSIGNLGTWGQYDANRINTLQNYADTIWSVNPDAFVILEHFADNQEESNLSGRGMMLWGNMNYAYSQGAMGYHSGNLSDFKWAYYKNRGWNSPNLMAYMESHDEERIVFKCIQYGNSASFYDVTNLNIALERSMLDAAFYFTIPGPKMIWQFGELGYDYYIDYNGRTGEKPVRWDYLDKPERRSLYNCYSSLIQIKKELPLFQSSNVYLDLGNSVKRITIESNDLNLVVVGTFDVVYTNVELTFPHKGIWYDFFGEDSLVVGDKDPALSLAPGEFHLFFDQKLEPAMPVSPTWPIKYQMPEGLGQIFPNPSSGELNLFLRNTLEVTSEVQAEIYDTQGRLVYADVHNVDTQRIVSLSDIGVKLKVGVYYLKLVNLSMPEQTELRKFVIYQ